MKAKLVSFLCTAVLLTTAAHAVDLYVDTNRIDTDTPPMIVNGSTLVPVRAIFEALGADVSWNAETRTATGTRGDLRVVMQIGNTTAYVNDDVHELSVPAQIINGRTMVPARFVSEALGCVVTWYGETGTAAVADKLKDQHIFVTPTGKHYHFQETCNGGKYIGSTLAEAMGRALTPCDKCVLTSEYFAEREPEMLTIQPTGTAPVEEAVRHEWPETGPNSSQAQDQNANNGNADRFDTYYNTSQQETSAKYVLNTKTMRIHHPNCSSVPKIAPENYMETNKTVKELEAEGYRTCGQKDEGAWTW